MHGRDHRHGGHDPIPQSVCHGTGPPTTTDTACAFYIDDSTGTLYIKYTVAYPILRSISSAYNTSLAPGGTVLTVPKPAGVQIGDVMIMINNAANFAGVTPTGGTGGWGSVNQWNDICGSYHYEFHVWARTVDGTEGSGFPLTCSTSTVVASICLAYRNTAGVDTSNNTAVGSATSMVGLGVTTTHTNDVMIACIGSFDASPALLFDPPATGFTARAEVFDTVYGGCVAAQDILVPAAGPTGTYTIHATRTPSQSPTGIITVALSPSTTGADIWLPAAPGPPGADGTVMTSQGGTTAWAYPTIEVRHNGVA